MLAAFDDLWKAASAHIRASGVAFEDVLAPIGFGPLLPGCWTTENPHDAAQMAAAVMHKGRLEQVPPEHLLYALDHFTLTFANEVFLVYARHGEEIAADSPHRMDRLAMVERALLAHGEAAKSKGPVRRERAPATLLGEGRLQLETAFGHVMFVDGNDIAIVPHLVRDGWFDFNMTEVIARLLGEGMTFIDVGANFGTYTLIGAAQVGASGRVLAFEPAPAIAALLSENVTVNGFATFATVMRCALGAQEGVQTLYEFAAQKGGNTLLPAIAEDAKVLLGETVTTQEVDCRTLDAVVAAEGLERVDLVKIDVEGFEAEVIEGARTTIARYRPRLIVEWHSSFFKDRPEAAQALYGLLTGELGYRLQRIDDDGTLRPVGFAQLMEFEHSDILAEPEAAPANVNPQ